MGCDDQTAKFSISDFATDLMAENHVFPVCKNIRRMYDEHEDLEGGQMRNAKIKSVVYILMKLTSDCKDMFLRSKEGRRWEIKFWESWNAFLGGDASKITLGDIEKAEEACISTGIIPSVDYFGKKLVQKLRARITDYEGYLKSIGDHTIDLLPTAENMEFKSFLKDCAIPEFKEYLDLVADILEEYQYRQHIMKYRLSQMRQHLLVKPPATEGHGEDKDEVEVGPAAGASESALNNTP